MMIYQVIDTQTRYVLDAYSDRVTAMLDADARNQRCGEKRYAVRVTR